MQPESERESKKHVADFLVLLAKDHTVQAEYKSDAKACMKKHGLSAHDSEVVLTEDKDKIKEYLGDDEPPGCLIGIFF